MVNPFVSIIEVPNKSMSMSMIRGPFFAGGGVPFLVPNPECRTSVVWAFFPYPASPHSLETRAGQQAPPAPFHKTMRLPPLLPRCAAQRWRRSGSPQGRQDSSPTIDKPACARLDMSRFLVSREDKSTPPRITMVTLMPGTPRLLSFGYGLGFPISQP